MLLFTNIDGNILRLGACSDNHSLVYGNAGAITNTFVFIISWIISYYKSTS